MLNPCLECNHHLYGGDKNSKLCAACIDRIRYLQSLHDPQHGRSVDLVEVEKPPKQTVELPPYAPTPQDEWLKGRCLDIATAIYSHLKECDDCDHPLEAWALELARTLRARNDIMKATE